MPLRILHLSDIHIGKTLFNSTEFVAHIEKALRDEDYIVDIIVITGDIFDAKALQQAKYRKYIKEATMLLENLIEQLNVNARCKLCKNDVFIVPGNHEYNRNNLKKPLARYRDFLRSFYGKIPCEYDNKNFGFMKECIGHKTILLGFNSANYKDGQDYGEISMEQISRITAKLDLIENKEEYSVIVLLHHHFYYIEERYKSYNDISTLKNGQAFLKSLKKYNLYGILHGHKHESTNRRLIINDDITKADQIVNVIACGSSGKEDVAYNSFNYIEVFDIEARLDIAITEFVCNNSSFEPQKTIELPIENQKKSRISIMEDFEKYDEILYREYNIIKDTDIYTRADDLIETLNNTVGVLAKSSERIEKNPKIIFYLLMPIHFRSKKSECINDTKLFIENHLKNDFNTVQKKELLFKILESENLYTVYKSYNRLMDNDSLSDDERSYLIFVMISFFLCEQHVVLRERAEEFFNKRIKSKSNINFEKNTLQKNIQGLKISFTADEERRSIGISISCKDANSHKVISLIIKEFALELSKYEDDFVKVGFNIYYLDPKIKSVVKENEKFIESYSFEAYIPTLIPLLAGENIYSQPEVFARELIQNSIDAIKVRQTTPNISWNEDGKIDIVIKKQNKLNYIEISDNGTGMNKYTLERYFTSIGRSFYNSDDYNQLGTKYKPISKFGIGLLSCFLVGKRIEVYTKYYKAKDITKEHESYRLEIPNFDGCFFIENNEKINIGTTVKVFEDTDKNNFNPNRIIEYVNERIINPEIDILIKYKRHSYNIWKNAFIEKIYEGTKKNKLLFVLLLPLDKDEFKTETFYSDENYRLRNQYGVYVYKRDSQLRNIQNVTFSSAGIATNIHTSLIDIIKDIVGNYFDCYVNFPSEMIELNVSRDVIINIKQREQIIEQLSFVFKKQTQKYIEANTTSELPYYIFREMDNYRFGVDKINLLCKDKKFFVKYNEKTDLISNNYSIINKWVQVILNNSTQFIYEADKSVSIDAISEKQKCKRYHDYYRVIYAMKYVAHSVTSDSISSIIDDFDNQLEHQEYVLKKIYDSIRIEQLFNTRFNKTKRIRRIRRSVYHINQFTDSNEMLKDLSDLVEDLMCLADTLTLDGLSKSDICSVYFLYHLLNKEYHYKLPIGVNVNSRYSFAYKVMLSSLMLSLFSSISFSLKEVKEGIELNIEDYVVSKDTIQNHLFTL